MQGLRPVQELEVASKSRKKLCLYIVDRRCIYLIFAIWTGTTRLYPTAILFLAIQRTMLGVRSTRMEMEGAFLSFRASTTLDISKCLCDRYQCSLQDPIPHHAGSRRRQLCNCRGRRTEARWVARWSSVALVFQEKTKVASRTTKNRLPRNPFVYR